LSVDGGIITLPLRAGVGWTRLLLRAGVDVVGCAVKAGGKVADQALAAVRQPSSPAFDVPPARPVDERAEPWPGYDQLRASQVIARLASATPAELAAVQLYESGNRDRQTVRAAMQRSLKTKTGRGSPDRKE
jgi:hypothetical protein